MIEKALVVRESDPSDGRAQTLRLTPAGRKLVPELAMLADLNDAEFFGHLAAVERQSLVRALQEIVERRGMTSQPVD